MNALILRCAIAVFSFVWIVACGESASSSTQEETLFSSSQVENFSSGNFMEVSSSSFENGESSNSSEKVETALNLLPDEDGFYDIGELYKAVPKTNRIIFVIRHSERESSLEKESPLTENGKEKALNLGKKLFAEEAFYYASTDFVRTRETCRYIAEGREEENFGVDIWHGVDGNYFLRVSDDSLSHFAKNRGGAWQIISRWAYADSTMSENLASRVNALFYDLFERGKQFVEETVAQGLKKNRVSVMVSHDVLLEPLTVYATNRSIDLRFYKSGRWIAYLAGVAIVVDENSNVELYPVRGDSVGYMTVSK